MNIKPFYQQVIEAIGNTQDGNKLNPKDEYGMFLLTLVQNNTEKNATAIDGGEVDTEELESNLRYAIDQFRRALVAVEKFNEEPKVADKKFFWKDKSGRGQSATVSSQGLIDGNTEENYDGITLVEWAQSAEEGEEWENATDKYICTEVN